MQRHKCQTSMALHGFIGTWEIIGCGYISGTYSDNQGLEGVRFRLDDNGDVIWTVPEELKSIPLFSCETYELYSTTISGVVLRFGAYAGHVLEFRCDQMEPRENLTMTCESWCMLHCKRIYEDATDKYHSIPFSLLPALEDGYFSDLTIVSSNKKQFKVHSTILKLQGCDIDWFADPCPFSNLPEDVLGTILHFLYAECLPENLTEVTTHQVLNAVSQYPCLNKLVSKCNLYLKNMALKQQIIGLVNDMHGSMNQIIEHFNVRNNHLSSENITSNPAKLCFVVKQSIRDAAVAGVKLLLLCDLFTKRKNELSREERHEIIRYAKSRLPIFLMQLQRFLQALKNTFSSMSAAQRLEVATFLVPEIEIILDTVSTLIVQVEKALTQIIQVLSPNDSSKNKSGVGEMLGKSLRNVLHIRELTKLENFHEHITCSLGLLLHKKENFNDMSSAQKVRSIARNLEQLIEELPIFLLRLEDVTAAFDEKLEWREFKFCFKVGTSKVSGILQKLVAHRDMLQDVVLQLCELVQRDSFNQSLQSLGLLDATSTSAHANECQKMSPSSCYSTPKHHHGYKLNLVESLCVSPPSNTSILSKLALQLFKNATDTDMEFEIVAANSEQSENETQSEEERIIKAHRVIVAARCDWFRRALLSGMREAIDKKIIIHDTNPFLFRIFLEYLYSGRLRDDSLSIEQLVELLLLSDRYEVDSLKQTCEYALQHSIDLDSALYFFNMADQYNARILKNFCLNFIAQHHELTESEVFFELPIALQAEIFDCVWTQPPPKSSTMEQLLPSSVTPPSPDSSVSERHKIPGCRNFQSDYQQSNSSSIEDLPLAQDAGRLDNCIRQLRDIIGDSAPREQLVQVVLAADYDLCRAVNFYYARNQEDE
ncbi:uncharacterized protein LOC100141518 [Tribolium castaneum]|uniref:BTB domain-containing protein n=2 Tax=Tribolium castaneum TaxID=7070 RepID=A0A139WBH9_TRICA|nr:PREDICTED: uncharacterized protein LOC100141518 [Tribolium castaneum]KYB25250.1 hypothetical protein TcasGA2_TC034378 [Tribolium castaneum]|eukprot:XP_001809480.2 PREDICTED: uncharacterized protein LOC100141518 [Tribolium castaneum]